MRLLPRIVLAVTAAIAMLSGQARATETVEAESRRDGHILWVEVATPGSEEKLQYQVYSPGKGNDPHGGLWQKCTFSDTSAATYRCGLDVGQGSAAARKDGRWLARAVIGGVVEDRVRFST